MKIIECPRDAMQGLETFIPTDRKIAYINQLLKVGFDTIDFGSFVSPRAIPQMRDTAEVVEQLDWETSPSKLLAIVANVRGAEAASAFEAIRYLGFPLSISETFQQRNTNKSIAEAFRELELIRNVCDRSGKELVTYISMGFGNPYGDPFTADVVAEFVDRLAGRGAGIISLADTVGVATPEQIAPLFSTLSAQYPAIELGVHLHATPQTTLSKIESAFTAGCRRFDGALKGFGGCPMANDELVGNLATETILDFLDGRQAGPAINRDELGAALAMAGEIFPK